MIPISGGGRVAGVCATSRERLRSRNSSDRDSIRRVVGRFLIYSREKRQSRVESHDSASANHRFHTGLRVAPGALSLSAEVERSEIAQLDRFAANKRVGHLIKGLIENLASFGAGQRRATKINRRSQVVSRETSHSFAFFQHANVGSRSEPCGAASENVHGHTPAR